MLIPCGTYTVYPAIGDAIDEDGSGFLSVYEVNRFFRAKPEGWSSPEWMVQYVQFVSFIAEAD